MKSSTPPMMSSSYSYASAPRLSHVSARCARFLSQASRQLARGMPLRAGSHARSCGAHGIPDRWQGRWTSP
jgi:hypothetical protein